MLKGAVARRYAEAILQIGIQQGTLDRWLDDVRVLGEAFGNRQLAFILREPRIGVQRKDLIVRDLLTNKVQHDALNLALLLVQDEIIEVAPRLAQEFERLYNEYRGQAVALVTSAVPLDDEERAHIAADLQRVTGKRIILEERVDAALLGGVVVRIGDTLMDGSVRRRLALLREQIIKGGGSFGGPLDGWPGSGGEPGDGPSAGGGTPDKPVPFVVEPAAGTGNGGAAPGAGGGGDRPSASTSAAPRPADAPRVAPRPPQPPQQSRRSGGRNKGRRR
ncbi:MAG: hypothetical protein PVSMB4_05910 [Ktedonobacterales bacterium]